MITTEQKTFAIFLAIVAATVQGLRREYANLIRSKAGPRDNGYTATFVEDEEEYLMEAFNTFWLREGIRASRLLQASRMGG